MTAGAWLLVLRIAMALAIYAFMAFALWQLWRELRRQAQELAAPAIPPLTLTEVETEDGLGLGRSFNLMELEATLGRDSTCEVVLDTPTVSARHARLAYHHGQWWVEDLRSTNGTFLNSQLVTMPLVTATGDELRCGEVAFIITITEPDGNHPGI